MKKKIAFVCLGHFDDLTDTKKLVSCLSSEFEVSFFGFVPNSYSTSEKKSLYKNFNINHFHVLENSLLNKIKFMLWLQKELNRFDPTTVYLSYFPMCSIISIISSHKIILDIRSSIISENRLLRNIRNYLLKIESFFFKNISIISIGLANLLKINLNKCHIVPLGADQNKEIYFKEDFNNFLYVGTFNYRRLNVFLQGFNDLIKSKSFSPQPKLRLVGAGMDHEVESIKKTINDLGLHDYVELRGEIRGKELIKEFDWATFGISYIPITSYFDCQPPTKTFEYLASGIPVLATSTTENKKIVNEYNGIHCNDSHDSVSSALDYLISNKKIYDSNVIRSSVSGNAWDKIAFQKFPLPRD